MRYLHMLLYQHPTDNDDNDDTTQDDYTFTELVDWLESFIDPFDLDVFSPHLTSNIQVPPYTGCFLPLGIIKPKGYCNDHRVCVRARNFQKKNRSG